MVINDFGSLGPRQTTAMLGHALLTLGCSLHVCGVADVGMDEHGHVVAWSRQASAAPDPAAMVAGLASAPASEVRLEQLDAVLCRTNPARDDRAGLQAGALQLLQLAHDRGLVVLNDPFGLARAASKAYLGLFPEFTRPRTITSGDRETLRRFVLELPGPAVLKPALGTRGLGVFRADRAERNLNQILDLLLERGMVIAQQYVPQADAGDTRVLVVEGRVLRVDGQPAAIQRIPGRDDFRSNIHAGGHAAPGSVTAQMQRVVDAVGPRLVADGQFLVGLDFIGDVLCEANVFSPGGLFDLERFTKLPFTRRLALAILERVRPAADRRPEPEHDARPT